MIEKEICKVKVLSCVTFPEARKMVNPAANDSNGRITYSAMAHPKITTASIGTQTDIVNCKCKPSTVQKEQTNTNKKENTVLRQASSQTNDNEEQDINNAEEIGNSSQQPDEGWTTVGGRQRPHSLSPRHKPSNRGHAQRGKGGEPPGKQFKGSQSPKKSEYRASITDDRSLGAAASGSHASSQEPRKKIDYPKNGK